MPIQPSPDPDLYAKLADTAAQLQLLVVQARATAIICERRAAILAGGDS
jgi:hypothetical protein